MAPSNWRTNQSFIKGVVGWVDLQSEKVEDDLATLSKRKKFVGVRHVVQSEVADFMLKPEFPPRLRRIARLPTSSTTFLLFPKHLPSAVKVVEKLSHQRFVLHHIAKPFMIRAGMMQPWKDESSSGALAKHKNVVCKISGMVTEAKMPGWEKEEFRPYLDVVFEAFGEDRVMFGFRLARRLLAASYEQTHDLAADYFKQFSAEVNERIFRRQRGEVLSIASFKCCFPG